MELKEKFLKLKQITNSITFNPLLNHFEQFSLGKIDVAATTDKFLKTKKKRILNLVSDLSIDFDPKLKSAFDEYSEALTYLLLKSRFPKVERIPESAIETPDFTIVFTTKTYDKEQTHTIYAELKTISFAYGNINYKDAMEQGLQASIEIERQLKQGKTIASAESVIQPWYNPNKAYDSFSTKFIIESLNEKIDQNIKAGQYAMGDTVLLVDLKQMIIPNSYMEGGVPFHVGGRHDSIISGVQWNVSFGKLGHNIFRPIEFEGKENIEGELQREGLLWKYPYIKAICFIEHPSKEEQTTRVLGLHRNDTSSDDVIAFLYQLCDFVNDDVNTGGFQLFVPKGGSSTSK